MRHAAPARAGPPRASGSPDPGRAAPPARRGRRGPPRARGPGRPAPGALLLRPREEGLRLRGDRLGLERHRHRPGHVLPRGTVAPGASGSSSATSSSPRPRSSFSMRAGSSLAPAKRSGRSWRRRSRTERGANASERGCASRASRMPVVRCVSGSKLRRLSTVSPRNSMRTGASRSGGRRPRSRRGGRPGPDPSPDPRGGSRSRPAPRAGSRASSRRPCPG